MLGILLFLSIFNIVLIVLDSAFIIFFTFVHFVIQAVSSLVVRSLVLILLEVILMEQLSMEEVGLICSNLLSHICPIL